MTDCVIRAERISKRYGISLGQAARSSLRRFLARARRELPVPGGIWALRDVSFTLPRGETIGIIGPNGAGKSTLLKILCGVTTATSGHLEVHGRTAPLIEVGAGFHPELTGRENILVNAAMLGMGPQEIRRKFDQIVAFSGMQEFLDLPVKKYSSGMVVRLGFSVAVHTDPDILLVDEVLSVGDANFQRRCMEGIQRMIRSGCSVVIVSHSMTSIQAVCNRVIWLDRGRVQMDGPPERVIAGYCEESDRRYLASQEEIEPDRSEPIVLERLVLRNSEGVETDSVKSLEAVELELHYTAQCRIERPLFWLGISHNQFGSLFGVSNVAEADRTPYIEGRGVMRARFDALPLMPGVYQIAAGARDETGAVFLTQSRIMKTFRVTMTAPGRVGDIAMSASVAYDSSPVIVQGKWLGNRSVESLRVESCANQG